MAKYAILTNNTVVDLIIASANEIAKGNFDAVEITEANPIRIGWVRVLETGEIVDPETLKQELPVEEV